MHFSLFLKETVYYRFFISCYRLIRGFQDRGGTKEFLFALPRFARNEVSKIKLTCDRSDKSTS